MDAKGRFLARAKGSSLQLSPFCDVESQKHDKYEKPTQVRGILARERV